VNYLADTNILLRLVQTQSPHHVEAKNAARKLLQRGDTLFITLQNVSEFWNVCTRPKDKNGLGFTVAETDAELTKIEQVFDFLPDTIEVYQNWRELVVKHSVSGVQVHDAKIAASMKAHNIENLLTFNAKDFKRYSDIKAVEPINICNF
jgi:predicted nucleic acid-binding protein